VISVFSPDHEASVTNVKNSDLVSAIEDFSRALQLNPKDASAYRERGIAKLERRDFDGAVTDFNHTLQLDPKNAYAYESRGDAKEMKGDADGAIIDYNRALELNPKLAGAYAGRGAAKLDKGEGESAIGDYSRALQLNPKLEGAYAGRAAANFLARNWAAALQDSRRFCELWQRDQEYPRLTIWMIRSRLAERAAADKELATHFKAQPGSWLSKVKEYLLGDLSEVDFLAAAASPDARTNLRYRCEAYFYVGMKNLLDGKKPAATDFFQKCVATEVKTSIQYHFAKAELKALGR
jgi:lipoprotein NlpI